MSKTLIPITAELVRELRLSGRMGDAARMISAFRTDVEKGKEQVGKEHDKQIYQIKKASGICSVSGCNNKRFEKRTKCEKHVQRQYNFYTDRKNKKVCVRCGRANVRKYTCCIQCRKKLAKALAIKKFKAKQAN